MIYLYDFAYSPFFPVMMDSKKNLKMIMTDGKVYKNTLE